MLTTEQGRHSVTPDLEEAIGDISPTPCVDVRVVLFTLSDGQLWITLEERDGRLSLPQGNPSAVESLDTTATRILADQLGVPQSYLEQLYSLSQATNGVWTVSVAYLGLAIGGATGLPPMAANWFPVRTISNMDLVDKNIVDYALLRLRAKLGYTTIAFHLLPPSFSLSELQQVYEAVLDRALDKRNFRRRIHAAGVLEATGDTRRDGSHRPAHLYRFRAAHDAETFLTPAWSTNAERKSTDT
jgi:8-oxo-dGTP diphosphatase